jgi:hypothetical protein
MGNHVGEKHTGGCSCGKVRFEATGAPRRVGICHCFTCRKFSGAAFSTFIIYSTAAVTIQGAVSEFRSSRLGRRYRCSACGGPVYEMDQDQEEIELLIGTFDDCNIFTPTYESWTLRREHWLPELPTILDLHEKNRLDDETHDQS